ncbi:MAG: response regulator [Planctomycetes bacterium]|jgi:DNA-binding response OmpR family regulator|nr:response regulator [Planctomycetota bacterium]
MPTVLLIDDNRAVTEIIRALLQRNNYSVLVANAPESAQELLFDNRVDVIVSDVMMPQVDGFELGRRIRANAQTANIPIIFLTALDSMEDEFEAWLSGADAFMVKPFKARDLLNSIEKVLSSKGRDRTISNGRIGTQNDSIRALAAVGPGLASTMGEVARECGLTLEFSTDFDDAFKRLDRGKFGLLICDASLPRFSVRAVSDYLRYFALNIPVLLIGASAPNEPRFISLPTGATTAGIAGALRDCVQRIQ